MSSWDDWRSFPHAPKKPPPARGIKLKKAGTTWWGQRWIEALQHVLRGDAGRLARGKTYARAGRTHDFVVQGGKVTAQVTGSRTTPYAIAIELGEIGAADWEKAIAAMAEKAQFSAELLAGQMPREIDELFRAAGTSLFPRQRTDLVTRCSCPDWGDPCKHVAAVHYVLGEALDRDPFLLFELRGRTKDQVLAALRTARGGEGADASERGQARVADEAFDEIPTVAFETLQASEYDKPREPLPVLQFSFDAPVTHGAVLRQLGAPAAWMAGQAPAELLAPLVRAAAETARRIALADAHPAESDRANVADAATSEPANNATAKPAARKPAKKRGGR